MDTKQSIDSETSETSKQYGVIFRFQKVSCRVCASRGSRQDFHVVGAMLSHVEPIGSRDGGRLVDAGSFSIRLWIQFGKTTDPGLRPVHLQQRTQICSSTLEDCAIQSDPNWFWRCCIGRYPFEIVEDLDVLAATSGALRGIRVDGN